MLLQDLAVAVELDRRTVSRWLLDLVKAGLVDKPPGKRKGLTTKLSVVIAIRVPLIWICAASPSGPCEEPKRMGANNPSTSLRLAFPPAPCAISICGSRNLILEAGVAMEISSAQFAAALAIATGLRCS